MEGGGSILQSFNPPAPPTPTHTQICEGSVSNRQTGTYLYIGLTFHRMCCPFLAGQQVWVGAGRSAGHAQKETLGSPCAEGVIPLSYLCLACALR